MIFYLHYILLTSGLSGTSVLLGVFFQMYSDASQAEIGLLLMSFPFVSIIIKPLFCSMADRFQQHQMALILSLVVMAIGYMPFVVLPFFPGFYLKLPRISWYVLVMACHVGNAGLGVAWSLGDALAVNQSQKTGTPYSRMRLMGTVSWGLYGYVIGQINEVPFLPKFVPAFVILEVSVVMEILLLIFWNKEDFIMFDPEQHKKSTRLEDSNMNSDQKHGYIDDRALKDITDSTPSSLGGTLRFNAKSAVALKDLLAADDLSQKLTNISKQIDKMATITSKDSVKVSQFDCEKDDSKYVKEYQEKRKNPQVIIFKMICREDGRLTKCIILFTLFGLLIAPMNFIYLSLPNVCKERGCNFSEIAGTMLVFQASVETLSFLVLPWFLDRISRSLAIGVAFTFMTLRYLYFTIFFIYSEIPPYWAIIGEIGHGIGYGIVCTIVAESALTFANQSKLFIPELRRLGLLSEPKPGNEAIVAAEESGVNMALKATMQAVFAGFMDGLGVGTGNLICGLIADAYSYTSLWEVLTIVAFVILLSQQIIELSRSKWSDSYEPKEGSKAFEILTFERQEIEKKINSRKNKKQQAISVCYTGECNKTQC